MENPTHDYAKIEFAFKRLGHAVTGPTLDEICERHDICTHESSMGTELQRIEFVTRVAIEKDDGGLMGDICNHSDFDAENIVIRRVFGPLHFAALKNKIRCLEVLLINGAEVNSLDLYGNTALHYSAQENAIKCLQHLLDKGADVHIKNNNNQTPLDVATNNKSTECVAFLRDVCSGPHLSNPSPVKSVTVIVDVNELPEEYKELFENEKREILAAIIDHFGPETEASFKNLPFFHQWGEYNGIMRLNNNMEDEEEYMGDIHVIPMFDHANHMFKYDFECNWEHPWRGNEDSRCLPNVSKDKLISAIGEVPLIHEKIHND